MKWSRHCTKKNHHVLFCGRYIWNDLLEHRIDFLKVEVAHAVRIAVKLFVQQVLNTSS